MGSPFCLQTTKFLFNNFIPYSYYTITYNMLVSLFGSKNKNFKLSNTVILFITIKYLIVSFLILTFQIAKFHFLYILYTCHSYTFQTRFLIQI